MPVYLPTSLFSCGVWDHRALRCGVATKGHIVDLVEASSRELRSSSAQGSHISRLLKECVSMRSLRRLPATSSVFGRGPHLLLFVPVSLLDHICLLVV
jgi:hypothetical protein